MEPVQLAAVLIVAVLLASMLSVELGIAVALFELALGVVLANVFGLEPQSWLDFLAAFGAVVLTFLATDRHAAYANVIRKRTLPGDVAPPNTPPGQPPIDTRYHDFISGPVATNTDWAQVDGVTGANGNGELVASAFYKPDPPNGVGMLCAQGDVYNYAQVTVTRDSVTVAYKDENGDTVLDVDGEPCGPYRLTG